MLSTKTCHGTMLLEVFHNTVHQPEAKTAHLSTAELGNFLNSQLCQLLLY